MPPPLRILRIVSSLNRGGIECTLMRLLRLKRPDVQIDIAVSGKGVFDDEARSLGSIVRYLPKRRHVFRFRKKLKRVLSENHYDAVHCSIAFMAGGVLKVAAECGVPVRIVHSHNTGWGNTAFLQLVRAWYSWFDLPEIDRYATDLVAISDEAGQFMFGKLWNKKRSRIVHNGISVSEFQVRSETSKRLELCKKYNIPDDAIVIGTVGRLTYQKNHEFLFKVFAELAKRDSRYILFIAGDGELRKETERWIDELGLRERVRLPGMCANVPDLLCQLFDVFAFSSRFEGFGNVFLEAIAGGLHCVSSNVVSKEFAANGLSGAFTLLNLSSPLSDWCDAIEAGIGKRATPSEGVALLKQTPFIAENSLDNLIKVYQG